MRMIAETAPLILSARYFKSSRGAKGAYGFFSARDWQNWLAAFLILCGIISGGATYAALNEVPPFGNNPRTVIWLLNIDLIVLLSLVALIAYRIVGLWSGRRRGLAGAHLHVRLVYIFSILAATPAIIMTVFSAFFFHFGVQTWFSERIQTAVNESEAVAEAYLQEHKQVIRADILAMANDLDRQAALLVGNQGALDRIMQTQSILRNLSEAIIFDSSGRVIARSGLTFTLEFQEVPEFALDQARGGEVVITTGENDDRVRALTKLNSFVDSFLYVGRMVDPQVLSHLAATRQAVESYKDLEDRYSSLQIIVTMIFVVVGLLMVLAAIWFGLILARQLISPISELITASDRVRAGDLITRVSDQDDIEEFDYLAKSFNRMTRQIQEQQGELIQANRQLDRRRRLTEAVLAGVSSGVMGLDVEGRINLANHSAAELLGYDANQDLSGMMIDEVLPGSKALLQQAHDKPEKVAQADLHVGVADTGTKTFLVRIALEMPGEERRGAILTFDDITELQVAQRKAAWADVARRIAHEIKNPLTPIQLSAERLKRRYLKQITDDPETFSRCTDTIVRHVEDIGRMVTEFSSFARMPDPVLRQENIFAHIEEVRLLQAQAHGDIHFNLICPVPRDELIAMVDAQQMRQALTNIIQNAVDSVHARLNKDDREPGHVDIVVDIREGHDICIAVTDNGLGFPDDETTAQLTEPYITHKPKGTGLGLAIVKKIMEDHDGDLILGADKWLQSHQKWRDMGGASVILVLPRQDG